MAITDYKTALVTGASSGIGAACVRALRLRGMNVLASARREDRLSALAEETGCEPLVLDMRDTEAVYAAIRAHEIDVLVNNAGLGHGFDGFLKLAPEEIDEMLEVNVTGAVHAVRAVSEGMASRRRGHIVNIGSVAGLYPIPFAVYGASKGAVHRFSQSLRLELQGTGVRVTEICPGRIETEFFDRAFKTEEERRAFTSGFKPLQAEDIADAVLYALDTPWHVNIGAIELTPTEQAMGGGAIQSAGEDQ